MADPAEVESWDRAGLTPPHWPALEFKRLETVKLGTLEAILTGVGYDDIDHDDLHNMVNDGGEEGPWIARVRPSLTAALGGLSPDRVRAAAEAWADTDEFKATPTAKPQKRDVDDLSDRLREMASLARRSAQAGDPMYLLMSL